MSRERPPRDDDDRRALERELSDVRPLAGREKVVAPKLRRRPQPGRDPASAPVSPERTGVSVEQRGERMEGLAEGVDRALLRRLRAGRVPFQREIDLHGLDARSARRALHEALAEAVDVGERCALVVHGRGRSASAGPVLKRALPRWLAEPPIGPHVLAFASALPRDGGAGATYVLLRRRRSR